MITKHFNEIDSTQSYLVDFLKNNSDLRKENIVVSTNNQTMGRGRGSNSWQHQTNAVAFSFTIKPLEIMTLTSLEVACHIVNFFKDEPLVKWPNDILNSKKEKVGGIIINILDDIAIVGIGLNIFSSKSDEFKSLELKVDDEFRNNMPRKIYQHILENRLSCDEVITKWNSSCAHLNSEVTLIESNEKFTGIFAGLGKNGEAILEIDGANKSFYNGSLII